MIRIQRRHFFTLICAIIYLCTSTISIHAIDFRKVAITGDPAPGTAFSYIDFGRPSLNNSGKVAFAASINTGNSATQAGLWSEGSGTLTHLAQKGSQAPGAPLGAVFGGTVFGGDIFNPTLSDNGQVVFSAQMAIGQGGVTAGDDTAIWTGQTGGLSMSAREGTIAPGTSVNFGDIVGAPGGIFSQINSTGKVTFFTSLQSGATSNSGIWLNDSGALSLIAREGNPAPGTSSTYGQLDFGNSSRPFINTAGDILFRGTTQSGDDGVWIHQAGTTSLVARTGTAAPGAPSGALFGFISNASLNSAGRTSFVGELEIGPGGVTAANDSALWSQGSTGVLGLVAREGTHAPGTAAGVNFSDFNYASPYITTSGASVFHASIAGPGVAATNDRGFWTNKSGALSLIVREGDAAPGLSSGIGFGVLGTEFSVSTLGQIYFQSGLSGPGVTTANDSSLWVENSQGSLQLVVREGNPFEVTPGVFKTVSEILYTQFAGVSSGGSDGMSRTFNDNQQMAFTMRFTDGSYGVFVATVPEPATISLIVLGGVGLLWRVRRKK